MNAAAAYQRRAVESASPVGLMILLYQAVVVQLRHAVSAMETEPEKPAQIEARTQALHRVLAIIGELQGLLRRDESGGLAGQLAAFYTLSEQKVMQAVLRRDPGPLQTLIPQYQGILDAWRQLEARPVSDGAGTAAWMA